MSERASSPLDPADIAAREIPRARSPQMEIVDLIARATELEALGQARLSADLYKTWLAFHADHPQIHAAYFNYAVVLAGLADMAGAIGALRAATGLEPKFFPPHINLGNHLETSGRPDLAIEAWRRRTRCPTSPRTTSISRRWR